MKKLLKHLAMRLAIISNGLVVIIVVYITTQWLSASANFLEISKNYEAFV